MLNNTGNINAVEQRKIGLNGNILERTFKVIAAPVFDFFKKEEETTIQNTLNIEAEIKQVEYNSAIFERTLRDADPKSRSKFNIVI